MYKIEKVTASTILRTENNIMSETMLKRFFEYLDVSTLTTKSYISGIKQFISFLGENNVVNPKRENVIDFKTALLEKGGKPATVSLYLAAIRRFFDWTESEKIYPNIARSVKSPKLDRTYHKRDYLSAEQLKKILSGISSKRDYAIFLLMSCCGLRTIEVARADICDIHDMGGIKCLSIQGKGKTDRKAFVKLPEAVMIAINEYLKERGQVKDSEPLFASRARRNYGKRLTTRTISQVCKDAMKTAGYNTPRLTAHSLRHSAATLSLLAGMSLEDVSQFLRHSSISVTLVYAHHVQRLKSLCEQSVCESIFGTERKSA